MGNFIVRTATGADGLAVEQLLRASYPLLMAAAYDPAVLNPALRLITKANTQLLTSGRYYLAESLEGEVIGCGGWSSECPPGTSAPIETNGHLRHFATHPEWTGRGVGKAIYKQCEAVAVVESIEEFHVFASLNAEDFYFALGFKKVRDVLVQLRAGLAFPSVLMSRKIC